MVELIRAQPAGILDRREWWSLPNSCEVMVVYGKDICSIHITNKSKEDITKGLAERVEAQKEIALSTTETIDSFLIECKASDVPSLLAALETVC